MALTEHTAPGAPGRPELILVTAPGGASVHLFNPVDMTVLCNGLRSGRAGIGGNMFFELRGCRRCAVEAVKRGYDIVIDTDFEQVELVAMLRSPR
ncbi:hypothetical protein [Umezawaea sp. Da 62-37]|uniref:hypothetical protein n=1 Tax=Umezawaea sp. Da 62-37 TaxID=3075927 RepID=UPI0028F6ED1A|nr:hypothetical protein [Umezawaea sp. Da 62-37]WNV82918.1 hypothetical protein RM788_32595 [Umezawaea sp. Da 62-37]